VGLLAQRLRAGSAPEIRDRRLGLAGPDQRRVSMVERSELQFPQHHTVRLEHPRGCDVLDRRPTEANNARFDPLRSGRIGTVEAAQRVLQLGHVDGGRVGHRVATRRGLDRPGAKCAAEPAHRSVQVRRWLRRWIIAPDRIHELFDRDRCATVERQSGKHRPARDPAHRNLILVAPGPNGAEQLNLHERSLHHTNLPHRPPRLPGVPNPASEGQGPCAHRDGHHSANRRWVKETRSTTMRRATMTAALASTLLLAGSLSATAAGPERAGHGAAG
jgi:hypothetical protein